MSATKRMRKMIAGMTVMENLYQHTHPVKADVRDCPACRVRASAPAMLEALLLVNENNDGVLTLDAIQAVRAAIAQATGE